MNQRTVVFTGSPAQFLAVIRFCREVYHRTFGPVEGERRLQRLTLRDAMQLYIEGLPESALIH